MKREKACGIIVYRKKDDRLEFLIIKHNMKDRENYWNFPKGHTEPGESEEKTARREVLEETGLDIEIDHNFHEVTQYQTLNWNKEKIDKEVVFFIGQPVKNELKIDPAEVKEARWLDYTAAKSILSYDSSKELLDKAVGFIKNYK